MLGPGVWYNIGGRQMGLRRIGITVLVGKCYTGGILSLVD